MFHLGWFLGQGFGIQPWRGTFDGSAWQDWMKPQRYVEMAAALERGGYDFVFIEDTAMIEDTYGGSAEFTLAHGEMAPKNDPLPLVPLMAAGTKHIGIINTMSTIQYAPYTAARLMTTLDHLTDGRVGLNLVTSSPHAAAQNFGHDKHLAHDLRYKMADEWMDPGRPAVGLLGPRRRHPRRGQRLLRRPRQSPARQLRRRVLQVPRPAQHRPEPPAAARHLPGRRLPAGPGARRPATPTRSSPQSRASRR